MAEQDDLQLDDAKEFIFVALRSQERFAANLSALMASLDKIKEGEDEWLLQVSPWEMAKHGSCLGDHHESMTHHRAPTTLLQVLEEAEKGQSFCANQLSLWDGFHERVERYVASVRKQAAEMAIHG